MASLAEQRAAIRAGISANFDSGKSAAASRRAIGAAMEASRRGTLKSDLNALESSPRKSGQLRTLERKGARPATSGVGLWNPARMPSSGGGLSGPLEEVSRTYHPQRVVWSADGLVPFLIQRVNQVTMQNEDAAQVPWSFADVP